MAGFSLQAQTVLYQTGFETPGYVVGNLAGQNGWTSGSSLSQNAAQIVAASGGQEVKISGSLVASNSPNFYYCSFSKSLTNYNPVASGHPVVDFSAEVWQNQGPTTSQSSWQFAFFDLLDQNGNNYGDFAIDKNGIVFAQNGVSVVSDGRTVTNGFHNFTYELNFTNSTITIFLDGFSCGSMAFPSNSSNELSSVRITFQCSNPIDATLFVDNLSITAGSVVTASPCDLQIVSAGPCLADCTSGTPQVGDDYGLNVTFNVLGIPKQPFRIKWTIANVTYYYDNINLGPGSGYSWCFTWGLNLDDQIPWSVTLDPDGVSGDTNMINNTASGTFTPIPPTNSVELYSPRLMHGAEASNLYFQPGSGNIGNLWVLFGMPTTHGAQQVISVTSPTNSQTIITSPYGLPEIEVALTNFPAGTFQESNSFVVQLNSMRVNPTLLRMVTWTDLDSMTTNWTQWILPDTVCQSTNALIAGFVLQSLPTNYQATLTPYDTARTLFLAVVKKLTYQSPPPYGDAVDVLQDGVADCEGFSSLLTACLRNVGIPARTICGFWEGDSASHVRTEFHLPGVEWLVADASSCKGEDSTGTYAFDFGYTPDANNFVSTDVGSSHLVLNNNCDGIEVDWWWTGGATFNTSSNATYLQPNGVLCLTNSTNGSCQFCLNDPPTEGSVVIQTSTNLITWSPVVTNSTIGSVLNYSFPYTNGPRRFYRANVIP
jgi:hypothetical protein